MPDLWEEYFTPSLSPYQDTRQETLDLGLRFPELLITMSVKTILVVDCSYHYGQYKDYETIMICEDTEAGLEKAKEWLRKAIFSSLRGDEVYCEDLFDWKVKRRKLNLPLNHVDCQIMYEAETFIMEENEEAKQLYEEKEELMAEEVSHILELE